MIFVLKFHEFCYVPVYEHGKVCDFTSKLVIVRLRCMQPVFCFSFLIQFRYHDFVLKLIIYIYIYSCFLHYLKFHCACGIVRVEKF